MGVLSSFTCELRIIQAKNMELNSTGSFFVRYYLSTGNNTKRVKLNSREISSRANSNFIWDESFSLECSGSEESIKNSKNQVVVFELRWRRRNTLGKSQLVGRAEVPWKSVFESPNMEMEKWVMLQVCKKSGEMKAPSLQVAMKVRVPLLMKRNNNIDNNKMRLKKNWDECRSGHGCSCKDYEMFALVVAFEGL